MLEISSEDGSCVNAAARPTGKLFVVLFAASVAALSVGLGSAGMRLSPRSMPATAMTAFALTASGAFAGRFSATAPVMAMMHGATAESHRKTEKRSNKDTRHFLFSQKIANGSEKANGSNG